MKKIYLTTVFFVLIGLSMFAQQTSLNELFNSCAPQLPVGWMSYSVSGSQSWECTSNGYEGNGIQMNGYSNGNYYANDDWLITPKLDISSYFKPLLRFMSRSKYAGSALQLFYSLNYSGSGNPVSATWTPLSYPFPSVNSDFWNESDFDLSSIKSNAFHLAIRYTSTSGSASYWRLDDLVIHDSIDHLLLHLGNTPGGSTGPVKSFQFIKDISGAPYQLTCQAPFEISSDSITFTTSLVINNLVAGSPYKVYVRIHPTVSGETYEDDIHVIYNGETQSQFIHLLGSSLTDSNSLCIASWNMRWFGYPSMCNCDTALAKRNALEILKSLHADMYCLQEVVNLSEFNSLVSGMGSNYMGVVSSYSSLASSPSSSYYSSGQKLAYIYKTDKIQNLGTFGLLKTTYPGDTLPYYCFASGRFPYVMKTVFQHGSQKDTLYMVNLHAKADATNSDYQRRWCAAQDMKDSLNALFPGKKIIITGDFNDYLEGSSVQGQTSSPYASWFSSGFTGISLPSVYPGQSTFVGSSNHLIDNFVMSNNLSGPYVDSSYHILKVVEKLVTNYANTTSDHYPILSYWNFQGPNSLEVVDDHLDYILNNPSSDILTIQTSGSQTYVLDVYDYGGRKLFESSPALKGFNQILVPGLANGIYLVVITDKKGRTNLKWIVAR